MLEVVHTKVVRTKNFLKREKGGAHRMAPTICHCKTQVLRPQKMSEHRLMGTGFGTSNAHFKWNYLVEFSVIMLKISGTSGDKNADFQVWNSAGNLRN